MHHVWFFPFYSFIFKHVESGFLRMKWCEPLPCTPSHHFITIFLPGQKLSLIESSMHELYLRFLDKAIARVHIILPYLFSDFELSINFETFSSQPAMFWDMQHSHCHKPNSNPPVFSSKQFMTSSGVPVSISLLMMTLAKWIFPKAWRVSPIDIKFW